MKPFARAILHLVMASVALAQEPSAKNLRTLLHADVKSYANDGRLVATWRLRDPDEMSAFTTEPKGTVELLKDEGLVFQPKNEGVAVCWFKELEFRQPFKVSFEVKTDTPDSSFTVAVVDSAQSGAGFNAGINVKVYSNDPRRLDYVGRVRNGKGHGDPSVRPTLAVPGAWLPVTIDYRKDRVALSVKGVERCSLNELPAARFEVKLIAHPAKVTLRDFTLDSQVDRDSIRKLFRSVTASASTRPKGANPALIHATAWMKIEEESGFISLDETHAAEIASLPAEAQTAIEAGLDLIEKDKSRQALASFEKAIGLAPDSAVVLWLAGVAAGGDEQTEKAAAYLESSVQKNAKLAPAWIALGGVRAERDEDERALKAFEQGEALDPTDPWVHVWRARLHAQRARLPDARRDIERAIVKRPESEGLKLLAKSLDRLSARPDWKDPFKKENSWYVVETTISSKLAAELAQRLVLYRRHLEKVFPLPIKQAAPSRVWVFDSEEEYQLFASSIGNSHANTLGLYHTLMKTLLLTSKVSADTTQHILFHEAFHQYLDLAVDRAPIWLNEGLAEYFGATTFDVSGRPTEGSLVSMRLPFLRSGNLLPIKTLMTMPPGAFMSPRGAGLHYAQSWALVHFFKHGGNPARAKLFDDYCAAVIAGQPQSAAFKSTFGLLTSGCETIDEAFRAYVAKRLLK